MPHRKEKGNDKATTQTRKCSHPGQQGPLNNKTKPLTTQHTDYFIHITMDDNQLPSTSRGPPTYGPPASANLMDIPPEIMQTIMSYLSFEDTTRLWRVNKRLRQLANMSPLWKEITISDSPLNCELITTAIEKQTTDLNIRRCSIQGSHTQMLRLENQLRKGTSKLKFLGLQGYKGSDILAAIIWCDSIVINVQWHKVFEHTTWCTR